MGIVECIRDYQNHEKIMQLVSKRTVYSYDEIVSMARKQTKVILFRLAVHLNTVIPYQWLRDEGVVNGQIRTITKISHQFFQKISAKAGLRNCLFAH